MLLGFWENAAKTGHSISIFHCDFEASPVSCSCGDMSYISSAPLDDDISKCDSYRLKLVERTDISAKLLVKDMIGSSKGAPKTLIFLPFDPITTNFLPELLKAIDIIGVLNA